MFKNFFKDNIFKASKRGEQLIIEKFLNEGVVVDIEDNSKWTPLHHSVKHGHINCAKFLLMRGADINHQADGVTPTPIFLVNVNDHDMASFLIENGANLNVTSNGFSPLMLAIEAGSLILSNLYIAEGADLNIQEPLFGGTALWIASRKGYKGIVLGLLGKGVDVNKSLKSGVSPLMEAAKNGHEDVVNLLIAGGANVNAKNDIGNTALDYAELKNHYSIARVLRLVMGEKDKKYYLEKIMEITPDVVSIIQNSINS